MDNPEDIIKELDSELKDLKNAETDVEIGDAVKGLERALEETIHTKSYKGFNALKSSLEDIYTKIEKQGNENNKSILSNIERLIKAVNNRPEVIKAEVVNQEKYPKEMKVSNLKDIKIPSFPEKVKVSKPDWLDDISSSETRNILKLLNLLKQQGMTVSIKNKDSDEAVPVRLSDGRNFYKAIQTAVSSGIIPFVDSSGNRVSPLVDSDRHLQTDVLNKLVPEDYDYLDLGYTGSNLTSVVYKNGGAGGTTVATLTLTYDGSGNLDTVTKT